MSLRTSFITLCLHNSHSGKMNRSFCLRAEVNYIFLFAELYIKKHKKLNIKLTNQVKIKNIQRMLFELGKKGFKSETICCE